MPASPRSPCWVQLLSPPLPASPLASPPTCSQGLVSYPGTLFPPGSETCFLPSTTDPSQSCRRHPAALSPFPSPRVASVPGQALAHLLWAVAIRLLAPTPYLTVTHLPSDPSQRKPGPCTLSPPGEMQVLTFLSALPPTVGTVVPQRYIEVRPLPPPPSPNL